VIGRIRGDKGMTIPKETDRKKAPKQGLHDPCFGAFFFVAAGVYSKVMTSAMTS